MQFDTETISSKVTIFQTNRFDTLSGLLKHPVIKRTNIVFLEQVHSSTINIVNPAGSMTVLQTDSLICTTPNSTLIIKTADCLPILITDGKNFVAAIHAGRKGTEQKILEKTLEKILQCIDQKQIPTQKPMEKLSIWFGPHICKNCYQINKETDEYYDLIRKNKDQLTSILKPSEYTLHISQDCTVCNNDTYFSYRKNAPLEGNSNYSAITLHL